jgi:alginate O-acetyltransferase complex protein AlgI
MLFSSPLFLFIFFPVFYCTFYSLRGKPRDFAILFASLIFYAWGEPYFVFVAFLSAMVDYYACKLMEGSLSNFRKQLATLCIVQNLSMLVYFKYANFFVDSAAKALDSVGLHFDLVLKVALPIGVSFIVFEKITYAVDIYRGKGKSAPSLFYYLLYVFMFPKLLAGPIIKYHDIQDQLLAHDPSFNDFTTGFRRFIVGLIKKVMFADTLAEVADRTFGPTISPEGLSTGTAWLGVICFTMQIYCDFSGYSDMAIGMARMMGFKLFKNFNFPYISASFSEFWRRWHISLSTWIKEYLYIPLGGNKCSRPRLYFNLWTCFLLSGLWHGANWNFTFWGAYNGVFLIFDRLFWETKLRLGHKVKVGVTLFFVMLGWVVFRCHTASQAVLYLKRLFVPGSTGIYIDVTPNILTAMIIAAAFSLMPLLPKLDAEKLCAIKEGRTGAAESIVLSLGGLLAVAKNVAISFNSFLYFRF